MEVYTLESSTILKFLLWWIFAKKLEKTDWMYGRKGIRPLPCCYAVGGVARSYSHSLCRVSVVWHAIFIFFLFTTEWSL